MKSCYKIAANAAIGGNNDIREYYEYLIENKYSIQDARNEIARYIAKVTYAIMKMEQITGHINGEKVRNNIS